MREIRGVRRSAGSGVESWELKANCLHWLRSVLLTHSTPTWHSGEKNHKELKSWDNTLGNKSSLLNSWLFSQETWTGWEFYVTHEIQGQREERADCPLSNSAETFKAKESSRNSSRSLPSNQTPKKSRKRATCSQREWPGSNPAEELHRGTAATKM